MSTMTKAEIINALQASQLSDGAITKLRNLDLVTEYASIINDTIQKIAQEGKRRNVSFREMGITIEDYSDIQVRDLRNFLVGKQYRVREGRTDSSKKEKFDLAVFWD